jgi:electron transport complex protein RnfG
VAINVLTTKETPGLGDKIKEDKFRNQYKGKGVENLEIVKTPTEEKIQAITGATISSKAVTDGVREAIEELKKVRP